MDGINTKFPAPSATSLSFQGNVQPFSINSVAKTLFNSSYGGFALLGVLSFTSVVLYSIMNAQNKKPQGLEAYKQKQRVLLTRFVKNNKEIQTTITKLLTKQQQKITELEARLNILEARFTAPIKLDKGKKSASTGQIKIKPRLDWDPLEFGSQIG